MPRDLRLLAGAVFLSAAGDLLAVVVLALQVHELTRSGLAVSGLFAATLVAVVALAPVAGLVADRVESVRVLVVASLAQAVVAVALAFAGDLASILALAALLAAGNAFAQPAEFALVPAVAGTRSVAQAMGLVEAARYTGYAAGPALAAVLVAFGPRPALLVNAASFLAIAAAAGALRARRPPLVQAVGRHDRALDGFRILRRDRVLRVSVATAVGALLLLAATPTVEIFFIKDVVGAGEAAYALVVCGWMAGMVAGATALAHRVPARLVAAGAVVFLAVQGAGIGLQTAWPILPVAFVGYLVGGIGHGAKNVLLRTLLSVRVPEALHGRAFAAYNAARNTAELGALTTGGALVAVLGPRTGLVIAAAGAILAAAAGGARLRSVAARPGAASEVDLRAAAAAAAT